MDECRQNLHNCSVNALCDDIEGDFKCYCKSGFDGDGVTRGSLIDFNSSEIIQIFEKHVINLGS